MLHYRDFLGNPQHSLPSKPSVCHDKDFLKNTKATQFLMFSFQVYLLKTTYLFYKDLTKINNMYAMKDPICLREDMLFITDYTFYGSYLFILLQKLPILQSL